MGLIKNVQDVEMLIHKRLFLKKKKKKNQIVFSVYLPPN